MAGWSGDTILGSRSRVRILKRTEKRTVTSKELSNCSGDHHKAYYTYILHTKVHTFYCICYMGPGDNFWSMHIKMHPFCYWKDHTRSRSVSVHLYLTYDASRAHRRGRGDEPKNE